MKFVATKTADQLDLQAMHRVRERLVSQRTGIINQIRAFLLERGVAIRQGLRFLRAELPGILAEPFDVLSPLMVRIIEDLARDCAGSTSAHRASVEGDRSYRAPGRGLRAADQCARYRADHLQRDGSGDWCGRCILQGPRLRRLAGLVPRQISTGDRTILGKISKRGNRYLRVLFVQAAWC